MKKVLSTLSILFLLVFTGSCNSDDDSYYPIDNVGGFTMVNAYEGSDYVRYILDGRAVQSPYQPLFYRNYGYINLWQGTRAIAIVNNLSENPIVTETLQIANNQYYTSFIAGKTEKEAIHFVTEDNKLTLEKEEPMADAGVRFFNLSSDKLEVSVKFNDKDDVEEFVNREQDSKQTVEKNQKFIRVTPQTYKVSIVDSNGNVLASRDGVELDKGAYYTITFVGAKDNQDKSYYIGVIRQSVM